MQITVVRSMAVAAIVGVLGAEAGIAQGSTKRVSIAQLEGIHFRAISSAAATLLRLGDVPRAKRAVENYRIELSEDSQWYYVHFVPRLALDEEPPLGGETSLGREVEFVLRKDSLGVVRHYFFE